MLQIFFIDLQNLSTELLCLGNNVSIIMWIYFQVQRTLVDNVCVCVFGGGGGVIS